MYMYVYTIYKGNVLIAPPLYPDPTLPWVPPPPTHHFLTLHLPNLCTFHKLNPSAPQPLSGPPLLAHPQPPHPLRT